MRLCLGAILACLALAAAGCGGSDSAATGGPGGASIAPKSAALYVTLNTDLDSDQVNQLEDLLEKFPDREKLLAEIQKGFAEEDLSWETDIKPALGETLDLVLLDVSRSDDVVGIVKPADEAKLQALVTKGDDPAVTRKVDGWTLIADSEAILDHFETARSKGTLEDDDAFEDAMDGLPDEALAKLYVNGVAATSALDEAGGAAATEKNRLTAIALALGAESSGLKLDGAVTSDLEDDLASSEPYEAKLLDAAPEGALAFVSGNGYDQVDKTLRETPGALDQFKQMLGVDLEGVFGLFDGEFALWVGRGVPIPEVTFLAEVKDEGAAMAALDKLAGLIPPDAGAQRRATEIDGVQAKQVVVEGFPITYATFDGRAIVTTRPGAISDVRDGGGDSLADDTDFKQAKEDAGMGDATFGFVYLNVEELAALAEGFAGFSGEEIPPEVDRNLEPLGSLLFHSGGKPEDLKLSAFLSIE
jgi:Protein of unknown function (DUF3352)